VRSTSAPPRLSGEPSPSPTRGWNTVPATTEPLKLRGTLPRISEATGQRLIAWALRQPDVMSWIYQRTAAYWEAIIEKDLRAEGLMVDRQLNPDQLHRLLDATAALDLLRWQSHCKDDRDAVEKLAGWEECCAAQ
jgi:hypothetical protein